MPQLCGRRGGVLAAVVFAVLGQACTFQIPMDIGPTTARPRPGGQTAVVERPSINSKVSTRGILGGGNFELAAVDEPPSQKLERNLAQALGGAPNRTGARIRTTGQIHSIIKQNPAVYITYATSAGAFALTLAASEQKDEFGNRRTNVTMLWAGLGLAVGGLVNAIVVDIIGLYENEVEVSLTSTIDRGPAGVETVTVSSVAREKFTTSKELAGKAVRTALDKAQENLITELARRLENAPAAPASIPAATPPPGGQKP